MQDLQDFSMQDFSMQDFSVQDFFLFVCLNRSCSLIRYLRVLRSMHLWTPCHLIYYFFWNIALLKINFHSLSFVKKSWDIWLCFFVKDIFFLKFEFRNTLFSRIVTNCWPHLKKKITPITFFKKLVLSSMPVSAKQLAKILLV